MAAIVVRCLGRRARSAASNGKRNTQQARRTAGELPSPFPPVPLRLSFSCCSSVIKARLRFCQRYLRRGPHGAVGGARTRGCLMIDLRCAMAVRSKPLTRASQRITCTYPALGYLAFQQMGAVCPRTESIIESTNAAPTTRKACSIATEDGLVLEHECCKCGCAAVEVVRIAGVGDGPLYCPVASGESWSAAI